MLNYTNNYKRNLIIYWQQFYPNWQIPNGYHVHHIKPKCTFTDPNDPRIHHPRNLIALHPDDHRSIHFCRGDQFNKSFMLHVLGRIVSEETKKKISAKNKGRILPARTDKARKNQSASQQGRILSEETKKKIGTANKGLTRSEAQKQRISAGHKGLIQSEFTKQKRSIALKGRKRPQEVIDKILETKRRNKENKQGK